MFDTVSRREFLTRSSTGLGAAALTTLLRGNSGCEYTHFAPQAQRVIYLFQSGAPSQIDLFDYKPALRTRFAQELPESIRHGQRLTGMTAAPGVAFRSRRRGFEFRQHGESGAWLSELLPHTAKIADDLCFVKSMHTEAINHDPAITFFQTGTEQPGRPSIGAWSQLRTGQRESRICRHSWR